MHVGTDLATRPTVGLLMESEPDRFVRGLLRSIPGEGTTIELDPLETPLDGPALRAAALTAVDAACELAAARQVPMVDLAVYHSAVRAELLAFGGQFGPVFVLPRSAIPYQSLAYQQASEAASRALGRGGPGEEITAATDGSYHRRFGGGAYGWVTSTGRHGRGATAAASALEAELAALRELLASTAAGSRLTVHLDSRAAITLVNTPAKERPATITARASTLLDDIDRYVARTPTRLSWVKGHAGHPLNDAADRLARLARQSLVFETETKVSNQIAATIVADALG